MSEPEKVFVSIRCKVHDNSISNEMRNRVVTGDEVFDFLRKDAQLCLDDNGELLPGDCNIYYMGFIESSGQLCFSQNHWYYKSGECSFNIIEEFISKLYEEDILNSRQYYTLLDKVIESRRIETVTELKNYLICKRDDIAWAHRMKAKNIAEYLKLSLIDIKEYLHGKIMKYILTSQRMFN
jgi:hypothetical protein